MKILFCSSEVVPFAKTGGLADVAGALPLALEHLGHEVMITLPKYKMIKDEGDRAKLGKNIDVRFIINDGYYMRDGLYGDKKGDYPDNLTRFAYYCKRTLELIKELNFKPDLIHCNDWQTGLMPVYLKTIYKNDPFYKDIKTVFTVHNLAYTGTFPIEQWGIMGLDWSLFTIDGLEYYGKFSLLKAGLMFSDALTTVSPTYAKEIQTPEFGCGMEGILQYRSKDLFGVLNGLDYDLWDPAKDKMIYKTFTPDTMKDKAINKEKLLEEVGIKVRRDTPLIGTVGRLAHQKGFDLLADIADELCGMDIAFVLLGTGEENLHEIFEAVAKKHKKNASISLKFDAVLAQKIYAASDIFLMPSRYEPCGLGQLISFKYGTVPLARKTGGLADTVEEYDPKTEEGNGFLFDKADSHELLNEIKKALSIYKERAKWLRLQSNIARLDFSWDKSAGDYVKIYKKITRMVNV